MDAVFEMISPPEEGCIKAFHFQRITFDAPFHFHPEFELTYIIESKGIRYVGNHISPFFEDDLVLLGPNLPHFWKNDKLKTTCAQAFVIQWPESLFQPHPEFMSILSMLRKAAKGIKFQESIARSVKNSLVSIINERGLKRYQRLIDLLLILSQQRRLTCLSTLDHDITLSLQNHDRLKTIQDFVHENYRRRITLAEVASYVHMGEQSFSRFFSKAMQKPFFSYLNEYRIQVAARLLVESNEPVAQIGYQTGFESLPFFYAQFKKYKKYSPLKFRKVNKL